MNRRAMAFCSFLGLCAATSLFVQGAYAGWETKTPDPKLAEIDKPVQDFKLKDVAKDLKPTEKEEAALVALSQFKDKKSVVLFFMSEKCGTTWRYEKRVGELMKQYGKDVAFLGVRCSANDTAESIRKFAEAKNFDMPVLNDENGEMTKFFKVRNTPTFVLVDKKGVMRYKGSFDDNPEPDQVKSRYLADAVGAVTANKDVPVKETRPFG